MVNRHILVLLCLLCLSLTATAQSPRGVVDEIIWVVGDDPILLSEVEEMRLNNEREGIKMDYCRIPEQIAVNKLFLHQATLDSIEVSESDIATEVNEMLAEYIRYYGSEENLEATAHQSVAQIKQMMRRSQRDRMQIQQEQMKICEHVKVTPAEVRAYFKDVPADSLPLIPEQVEVQVITSRPEPTQAEIERIQSELREFTRRINEGETTFATLARFHSEDGSARNGGEMDYAGRAQWVPEFANVAFSLNDPNKVSKIVKTEYGYHIIQLIDKRGDRVKVRHILLRPKIADSVFVAECARLDSIADDIRQNKFSFEEGALSLSDDKDSRANKGLLSFTDGGQRLPTSRFQLDQLPREIAATIDTMKVGDISRAIIYTNEKDQKICAIVRLYNRIPQHHATPQEDFQRLHDIVYNKRCEEEIERWVKEKVKKTYVRIKPQWRNCNFKYEGWLTQE